MLNDIVGAVEASAEADGEGRSARRIASVIGRMITAGQLQVGARLPTVRELSRRLGVSPTTVSEAWRSLAAVGAIEPAGRRGTFVRAPSGPASPRRYRRITEGPGHFALDLSSGTPDPALLPDLGPLIARVGKQTLTSSYLDHPVLPELEEALVASWPFPPEVITVVDGAMDALDRLAQVLLRLGDRVVVEHPSFPPLLDLLEQLGCEVTAVGLDDDGPRPDQLRAALHHGPVKAFFLQPRAQNPAGSALTPARAQELAEVLADAEGTVVVEDDHANDISSAPLVSLGRWLPSRTVHVRSFSKSHGPDLRLAAVGGAGDLVAAVANRRLLGPGWSSRILQAVLLELIRDPATPGVLQSAAETYARRRAIVSDVLASAGIAVAGRDGINAWVTVGDERAATMALATRGIGVAPGGPFLARSEPVRVDHVRVTVGLIAGGDDHVADVADALVQAARLGTHRVTHR